MSATLNKIIVLMSLFCVLVGYQNFGRVQEHEINRVDFKSELQSMPAPDSYRLVTTTAKPQVGCLAHPDVLKAELDSKIWLKADWGKGGNNASCEKASFVGWSIYNSEGDFVLSLENKEQLSYEFSKGKYTVILSYSGLKGSGEMLRARADVLDQFEFELLVE